MSMKKKLLFIVVLILLVSVPLFSQKNNNLKQLLLNFSFEQGKIIYINNISGFLDNWKKSTVLYFDNESLIEILSYYIGDSIDFENFRDLLSLEKSSFLSYLVDDFGYIRNEIDDVSYFIVKLNSKTAIFSKVMQLFEKKAKYGNFNIFLYNNYVIFSKQQISSTVLKPKKQDIIPETIQNTQFDFFYYNNAGDSIVYKPLDNIILGSDDKSFSALTLHFKSGIIKHFMGNFDQGTETKITNAKNTCSILPGSVTSAFLLPFNSSRLFAGLISDSLSQETTDFFSFFNESPLIAVHAIDNDFNMNISTSFELLPKHIKSGILDEQIRQNLEASMNKLFSATFGSKMEADVQNSLVYYYVENKSSNNKVYFSLIKDRFVIATSLEVLFDINNTIKGSQASLLDKQEISWGKNGGFVYLDIEAFGTNIIKLAKSDMTFSSTNDEKIFLRTINSLKQLKIMYGGIETVDKSIFLTTFKVPALIEILK